MSLLLNQVFHCLTHIAQRSRAENKGFTHQPAMTCGFSFSSHRITKKLTNGLLLSPTISTKIKLFNRSQILTSIWLLFIFRNSESLTNVVYFDVWPVCVVGRSLTGVIICLGNCEPEEGEIERQRGREREREHAN